VIKPTVGRKVWYRPAKGEAMVCNSDDQPMDATIIYVWNDRTVNLVVHDHGGSVHMRRSTLLLQGDEQYDPVTGFCEWMPFQQGQAKATEHQKQAAVAVSG